VPLYEFRCPDCGPFDLRCDMQDAAGTAPCPSCTKPARRRYSVGVGGPPGGVLRDAGRSDRARVDRARSGEPMVTGPPSGRRLPRTGGHRH
jgi:putative FmdB family regulatory protein